ncbi:MAG TPA: phosphate uptake regulator PhoU [Thermoplasmata archaeon]|nr:phosphate uptake regulator PhoU [Thermoplasmata archaeon]
MSPDRPLPLSPPPLNVIDRRLLPPEPGAGRRVVQRMGSVTVGVSLPRAWVAANRVGVGSRLRAESLRDGVLLLRPDTGRAPELRREVEAVAGEFPEHLFRRLIAAYVGGASEIEINEPGGIREQTRGVLHAFLRRTGGNEILSEERERLTVRDVAAGAPLPLPKIGHRMHQVVAELFEDAGRSWESRRTGAPQNWSARDDEVDRHAWLVQRILTRRVARGEFGAPADEDGLTPLDWLMLARSLERIADHAVLIGETGARLADLAAPAAQLRSIAAFQKQAEELLRGAGLAVERADAKAANDLLDTGEALHQTCTTLHDRLFPTSATGSLTPAVAVLLGRLLQSIDRVVSYTQDLAEVALARGLAVGRHAAESTLAAQPVMSHDLPQRNQRGERMNEKGNRAPSPNATSVRRGSPRA